MRVATLAPPLRAAIRRYAAYNIDDAAITRHAMLRYATRVR